MPSSGPLPCRYVFCGEAPGSLEDKKLTPFIGKTGDEVNRHYLPLAGLRRERVRMANAIRCLPISYGGKLDPKREKDRELLNSCASHHLYPELIEAQPQVVIPMGAFACMAIDPEIDLEVKHGFPLKTSWGMTFPMYHPAGGIHEPKKMLLIRNDWIRLGLFLKDQLRVPRDEYPNPDYRRADYKQVREDLADATDKPIACDTESRRGGQPHCLTYSVKPGTGRLILAEDVGALAEFQHWIGQWQAPILWHNWLYDIQVVTNMGLTFPHKRIIDTMVRVFHLGNLPQGLKALAWRELGMQMQDFDDVVSPHSAVEVLNYYKLAALHEWPKPDGELIRDKNGKMKLYQPQSLNTLLKRFFTDLSKNPQKDLFEAWANWEDKHDVIEEVLGPFPGKCISHVPHDEVLYYAVRDADALLRLWPKIKVMLRSMRKMPQEQWAGWKREA